ncbi:tetratricopeptide repeat protein [Streptomyces carpinensis]|uniref:Tetratricopeptide repeat protein n=1 Tax=Streptomyces carpinensis TaxID=66369 RepID=A0ABV1WDI5_9ACTN|nr:tetratricopeptide repeat protein [Streptomyces carpinensis]
MDAVDLDHHYRTYDGWIPPTVVAALHEHGYAGILHQAAAGGDWFCAHQLAEAAVDEGGPDRQAEALALLEPFVSTGWWPAVRAAGRLLAEWKRVDEAVQLLRPHADTGHREAVRDLARLLAGQGRIDQVVALLGPRTADRSLAAVLVELTAGYDRDDEIAALLPAVDVGPTVPFKAWSSDAWDTVPLHATLLERQGRVDEAAALLRAHVLVDGILSAGHAEQLASLLARHGLEAELRALLSEAGEEYALTALAGFLEERGRIEEAVDLLRQHGNAGNPHAGFQLAEVLARHGRHDEAIEALRHVAETAGGDADWIIRLLCRIFVEAGQEEEALAYVDDYFARHGGHPEEHALARSNILKLSGRAEEAGAVPRSGSVPGEVPLQTGTLDGVVAAAERLVRQGEPEKVVTLLRDHLDEPRRFLGEHL